MRVVRSSAAEPAARVLVAGASGRVGGELLRQLAAQRHALATELGGPLVVAAAADRRGFICDHRGVGAEALARPGGERRDVAGLLAWLGGAPPRPAIFVDCTSAAAIAARYEDLLERGIGVVTASKLAPAGPLARQRRLHALARACGAPYRYETTVGAALPILGPLAGMRLAGDRLRGIAAVLSGSLSFVLARVMSGVAFSAAVREAMALGYTEPHPADDLGAEDVARKLVILLREAGVALERAAVTVVPLVATAPRTGEPVDAFLERLATSDTTWSWRAVAAAATRRVLVPVARWDGAGARFAVEEVEASSPLARLQPGENLVQVESDRYHAAPLLVAGPGAGPAVTAAGVLADLVLAAHQLRGGVRVREGEPSVAVPERGDPLRIAGEGHATALRR